MAKKVGVGHAEYQYGKPERERLSNSIVQIRERRRKEEEEIERLRREQRLVQNKNKYF